MKLFARADEKDITRGIVQKFTEEFLKITDSEVIIVGAGPSGLTAGEELARRGVHTVIFEGNNYLGGGFWIGGYLMNHLTIRAPGQKVLEEFGVPYEEYQPGLYTAFAPHCCSKLIAACCDANCKIVNMTSVDDVVLRDGRVAGVVINWTPIKAMPREITCVDPVSVEGRVVMDCTGHDAAVCKALADRGLLEPKGFGAMSVNDSEDVIVEYTKEAFPGLVVVGMAVSQLYGLPRMGPTFGGMLISGKKAAAEALRLLGRDDEAKEITDYIASLAQPDDDVAAAGK
jgi:thiazole biosynthesis enzyme